MSACEWNGVSAEEGESEVRRGEASGALEYFTLFHC